MPAPRAVLFDFNGTLSNDEPLLCSVYQELFARHGRPLTESDYYGTLAGLSEEAIVGTWLGVDGVELEALVRERVEGYRQAAADGHTVSDAVRDAVRYAAARVPVGVVSGAFRAEIEPVLAAAGLAELFAVVVAADDVEHGKPAPDGYAEAVRRLRGGLRPADVVAFEDTEAGIASAKAAGLRCLGVRGTLPPERLRRADELVDGIDASLMRRLLS